MCGRFTLTQSAEAIATAFGLDEVPTFVPGYNIAPSQPVPVIRADVNQHHRFDYLYWGLIPSWAKDPAIGSRLINARSETVAEKPSFRTAFKRRRCLIAADGFYEWQRQKDKRQPFYFHLDNHRIFGFAGLWEHWQSPSGDELQTCTILTTEANEQMQPIHDRMPAILHPRDYAVWLDPAMQTSDQLLKLLHPYEASELTCYPVSPQVNSPRNDSPACIAPLNCLDS
ncbi:MAG: SOS response-associated peptidase [Elainella sp. Prado103]|jgi:putative SOS response-associated peptidase YedK|nr:SOS response-associated peptidase [Elainella sp. Prado103]